MHAVKKYDEKNQSYLFDFLYECLPESGRRLELDGRHQIYYDIDNNFMKFWCLFEDKKVVGTVALKEIECRKCELKSLYLLQKYHGKGLGHMLLMEAVHEAMNLGYEKMYLDTLATSEKAISLYKKVGFVLTESYNQNNVADIFMVLDIRN